MRVSGSPSNFSRRAFLSAICGPVAAAGTRWTQFRGDGASSVGADQRLPLKWSDDKNVAWSVATPGYGQSSPVVYGDKVFVTSVEGAHKETLMLAAHNLSAGKNLWMYQGRPGQSIEDSNMISKAAPTPAVDADAVYAFFETGNLAAIDHIGKLKWERQLTKEFGEFGGRHGIGSSVRLCGSGLLVLVAHDGPSYLLCTDHGTGETVWKADRPKGFSWSTPSIAKHDGREIALVSVGKHVDAYDTADGSLLWTLDGLEGAFIASPTPIAGGAIIGSSRKAHTVAIRFGSNAKAMPEIVWRATEAASYFSSPLVHQSRVYMVSKAGVAFCLDAESGEEIWRSRLEGPNWASPIGLKDRVYFCGVNGVTEVIEAGTSFTRIARNSLSEESRLYGTAVAEDCLLLRYGRRLIKVSAG